MMVLDYLNVALKVNDETSEEIQEYKNYDLILSKLSDEVKSWSFMYTKGKAKYEFEDCNSAVFFLSYSWDLLQQYGVDLDFLSVCCAIRLFSHHSNKHTKTQPIKS